MRFALILSIVALAGSIAAAGCKSKPSDAPIPVASAPAVESPPAASTRPGGPTLPSLQGKVLETTEVANYTYLQLDTANGKVWAAVPKTNIAVGDQVTVDRPMPMRNFHSPTLNKDYDVIYFGVIPGGANANMAMPPHPTPAASVPKDIKVAKAKGPNAYSIEEIAKDATKLNGKQVVVQGMVVKVNTGIMDRNWIHIQDGTGTADAKSNDLLVTSSEVARVGEVVVVKGKVAVDKNFGSGYAYKFIVEEASFAPAKP
ncbi:MAG: nucleotide-binding protein [Deltaproteobacteria bacterium]|nr:nucleotide-binding protein [Deltaproteobacteria bacterium]